MPYIPDILLFKCQLGGRSPLSNSPALTLARRAHFLIKRQRALLFLCRRMRTLAHLCSGAIPRCKHTERCEGGGQHSFRLQQRSPSVPPGLYIASLYTHYKGAKVYLYGSHVWLGLITYGGIILSFIKRVGAGSRGV